MLTYLLGKHSWYICDVEPYVGGVELYNECLWGGYGLTL